MEFKKYDFSSKGFLSKIDFEDSFLFLADDEKRIFLREMERHNKELYCEKKKSLQQQQEICPFLPPKQKTISPNIALSSDEDIETDISFYENLLFSCPSFSSLPHYLPKRTNPSFFLLMNQLAAKILKDIVEIQNFISEEVLSFVEKEEFLKEIKEKQELLRQILFYRDQKDLTDLDPSIMEKENTLLFLQSPSGNYYALQDDKNLEQEYYSSFWKLLESIKKGTFKNLKIFKSNNKLKGLLEVKEFKTRIVFQRLEGDVYVILSMFLKKVDNDSYYRDQLEMRFTQYQKVCKMMKERLKNESYLQENEQIVLQLKKKWGGGLNGDA